MVSIRTYFFDHSLPRRSPTHQQYAIAISFALPSLNSSVPRDSYIFCQWYFEVSLQTTWAYWREATKASLDFYQWGQPILHDDAPGKKPQLPFEVPTCASEMGVLRGRVHQAYSRYCPDKMLADLLTISLWGKAHNLHSSVIFSGPELWGECRIITLLCKTV